MQATCTYFAYAGDRLDCFKRTSQFKDQSIAFNFVQKLYKANFFCLDEMRNQTRSAKTRPLLTTYQQYAESCQIKKKTTTHNDHQKKEKVEPQTKIRIEQKAPSSLQKGVQIYIHNRYDRSFLALGPPQTECPDNPKR